MVDLSGCLVCGVLIELEAYGVPMGVMALGDRLMHEGCVFDSAAEAREIHLPPAYLIPANW